MYLGNDISERHVPSRCRPVPMDPGNDICLSDMYRPARQRHLFELHVPSRCRPVPMYPGNDIFFARSVPSPCGSVTVAMGYQLFEVWEQEQPYFNSP
ncbi:hypothetical protein ElyMa_000721300 [Elysia marginata]|uniref:Uncharacterized protein n=1 Tax=Elysia marginata TaxID=1093978 RepID=A0AAV4GN07_9GAST|nr:hypothetical protein ElyMa_000721300 [Elysia marginata]